MIRIDYNTASFRKEFSGLLALAQNQTGMLMVVGRELGNRLKDHFRKKDRSDANSLSSRRSHFWLQVSRTVGLPEQTGYNEVSVTVADPRIAQKVFGGTITAKRAGALTIPVSEEAYGRTAATFERETGLKLFLLRTGPKGQGGAFQNAVLAAKRDGGLEIEYILVKSVDQQADPTALPEPNALRRALIERGQKYLNNEGARKN